MVLLPPSPPAHGALGGTRGALLVTTLHCWVQPPPARSFRVILRVARGAELFSPAPRSGRACSSPQLMAGNESPVCRAEDPAPTARPLAGRAPSTIVLHGGSAGSPRTHSASQLMENVSSAALAPLGRTTDACSMGGREGREEPTGKKLPLHAVNSHFQQRLWICWLRALCWLLLSACLCAGGARNSSAIPRAKGQSSV